MEDKLLRRIENIFQKFPPKTKKYDKGGDELIKILDELEDDRTMDSTIKKRLKNIVGKKRREYHDIGFDLSQKRMREDEERIMEEMRDALPVNKVARMMKTLKSQGSSVTNFSNRGFSSDFESYFKRQMGMGTKEYLKQNELTAKYVIAAYKKIKK